MVKYLMTYLDGFIRWLLKNMGDGLNAARKNALKPSYNFRSICIYTSYESQFSQFIS